MNQQRRVWRLACVCALWAVTGVVAAESAEKEAKEPIRILLIGNSQCPTIVKERLLERLAESDEGGHPLKIGGCIKGGASLKSHWEAGTGEGSARAMIASKEWDYVLLQDIYFTTAETFQPYARKFYELVKESGEQPVFFGTASILSDYPAGFARQHQLHLDMGRELHVPIVDASPAYVSYFGENPSQERLESLFAADKAHPGLWGCYLYSCIIYSTVTGRTPVGLAAPESIPAETAKLLQETAWSQYETTKNELAAE